MKPSALRAGSAPQTNCSAFPATAKHGSLIPFPTEHRHAPARGAAIDSVQHEPSLVSPPLGIAGANRTIFVVPIDKGLAGICARAELAKKISTQDSNTMRLGRILFSISSENRQLDSRRDHRAARDAHQRLASHQSGRQQNPRPALGLILRSENRMRQRADKNRDAEPEWKIETDGRRHDRRAPLRSVLLEIPIAETENRRERRPGRDRPERQPAMKTPCVTFAIRNACGAA